MLMHTKVDAQGRITATSKTHTCGEGEVLQTYPEGFEFEKQNEWRIQNGVLIHDPLPQDQPAPTEAERLAAVEAALLELAMGGALDG